MTNLPETKDLTRAVARYDALLEDAYKAYYTSESDPEIIRACQKVVKQGKNVCALIDALTAMMLDDLEQKVQK